MTTRLYYHQPYQQQFNATIQNQREYQGQPAVILNQTAFYPTGGGQPHDTGQLDSSSVINVLTLPSNDNNNETAPILHILSQPLPAHLNPGDTISGQINWARRLDFMQQHSGQHLLSQALIQTGPAETIGFHLSQTYTTIDTNRPLSQHQLQQAENLANDIIYQNRPITARFVSPAEVARLPLRKPPSVRHNIRVVEIQDFDWSACGGTHLSHTGAIGQIKISRVQNYKGGQRLTFLCGQRSLHQHQHLQQTLHTLAQNLRVPIDELEPSLNNQLEQLKTLQQEYEALKRELFDYQANELLLQGEKIGGFTLITHHLESGSLADARHLVQTIQQQPRHIALIGHSNAKNILVLGRADDVSIDLRPIIKTVMQSLNGGGGGQAHLVQGGFSTTHSLTAGLMLARTHLLKNLLLEDN